MSLLTRCPACTTIYRLVPDQLRISQGWVKCGQCGDIFDATQHLVQIETEALSGNEASDLARAPGEPVAAPSPDAAAQAELVPTDDDANADAVIADDNFGPTPDQPPTVAPVAELSRLGPDLSLPGHPHPHEVDLGESVVVSPSEKTPEPKAAAVDMTELSFMRDAAGSNAGQRHWKYAMLFGLAIVLAGALATQLIYRQRHDLAATLPQAQPALQALCGVFGCSLEPVQRIDSVLIDAAAFNHQGGTGYLLSLALKNAADVALAMPSVELTLTDLQERAVVRRVFSARELDPAAVTLPPLSEWRVSVPLALQLDDAAQRVVGYRVRVFYP
ncbi:MAG: zinc-ribbon and DUF3426 domain-containing protein [Rhodoferax sp.]|nr:zinc-ribbon and DUF3426 domain-containing protein [Rhodoferax sp.]